MRQRRGDTSTLATRASTAILLFEICFQQRVKCYNVVKILLYVPSYLLLIYRSAH